MSHVTTELTELLKVVQDLRDPDTGCPWDREQTHQSLTKYLIEEAYEVVDAIRMTPNTLPEELGDVLLQILLHCQIASEEKRFSFEDVCRSLKEKLISRHPHVFGDQKAATSAEVVTLWERRKQAESPNKGPLDGVPQSMPALLRAQRISEKAARVGFEWPTLDGIGEQILDEVREFVEASRNMEHEEVFKEFGDILFSLVQLSRRLGFEAENALQESNIKFLRRFRTMERLAHRPISEHTLDELQDLWIRAKSEEHTIQKTRLS
jgi:MazG family protein